MRNCFNAKANSTRPISGENDVIRRLLITAVVGKNTKIMVKKIILFICTIQMFACKAPLIKPYDIRVSLGIDSIYMNDKLPLQLKIKNISNENMLFYPNSKLYFLYTKEGNHYFGGEIPDSIIHKDIALDSCKISLQPNQTVVVNYLIHINTYNFSKGVFNIVANYYHEDEKKYYLFQKVGKKHRYFSVSDLNSFYVR